MLGVAAPADVSLEVVTRVGQAIREASELPEVQKRMTTVGLNSDYRSASRFREIIASDYQKYGAIIRDAGIQPE